MPRLIKNGAIVDDRWLAPVAEPAEVQQDHIATLQQWQALENKTGTAVQLEPGDDLSPLLPHLGDIELISVNFTAFTDGRGFSYARELRERGYQGELRASGNFMRDQMTYLHRVGIDAFQPADDTAMEDALNSLDDFSEHYQASIDKPVPLFRRRN
ncbi:MAG: hypothetical protein ACI9NT_001160 [Bacteroidia bacterium]|jgi:uncharacterized protein (DUF934 family)